jgi:hypothetical protein
VGSCNVRNVDSRVRISPAPPMNPEDDLDRRTLTYTDMVKLLMRAGNVRAAFINYLDSELIVVIRDGFKPESLDEARERLPMWLSGLKYPKDPSILYSSSCTKILGITTTEVSGSPNRLMLMYPELERIL